MIRKTLWTRATRVASFAALLLIAGMAMAGSPKVAKLTHSLSAKSHYQVGAEKFKELVESRTGGGIEIEIYPAAQLGAERDSFEGLSMGIIEFAIGTSSLLGQTYQIHTDVFALPWLYANSEQMFKLLDSDVGKNIYASSKPHGIEVLTCYASGFRQLSNSVRPVNTIEDVKGLKIRTPEAAVYVNTMEAIGASPTPLAWSEVFSALQTGVVDGQETPMSVFLSDNLGEVQKYFAFTNYMVDPIIFAVSNNFMGQLSPEEQKIVRDSAYEAALHERAFIDDLEQKGVAIMEKEYGVAVTYPDPEAFKKAVQPLYDAYRDQTALKQVQAFLTANP